MLSPWYITLLGDISATSAMTTIRRFRTAKTGELLGCLAFHMEQPIAIRREQLVDWLWPDSDRERGFGRLRVELTSLRKQLEPSGIPRNAVLVADHAAVRLNPAVCETDVVRFRRSIVNAQRAHRLDEQIAALQVAASLYTGELLQAFESSWIIGERSQLANSYTEVLVRLVELLAQQGLYDEAVQHGLRAIQHDRFHEGARAGLMRAYALSGRQAEALNQYDEIVRLLDDELAMPPSPMLRTLMVQVANQDLIGIERPMPPQEPTVPPVAVPEVALLPPVLHSSPLLLPLQFTYASRFFGREDEIEHVVGLLTQLSCRLVTLTGLGGIGKTRLAMAVVQRLANVAQRRVLIVALAERRDASELLDALLEVLRPGSTAHMRPEETLEKALAEQPTLLVLDNFEQLVSTGAPRIYTLLQRIPTLTCLVTSRRALALPGEHEVLVTPLHAPNDVTLLIHVAGLATRLLPRDDEMLRELARLPSLQLLIDRSRERVPDFALTWRNAPDLARLCLLLEGVPLAIEIVAARGRMLVPQQMVHELSQPSLLNLRDRSFEPRQQSLLMAITWSYNLLPPALQHLLVSLAVFRGGWSIAAAAAVCDEPQAHEYLSQLRSHSLIELDASPIEMRFRMLTSLQLFGNSRRDDDALERRHLNYFLGLAEQLSEGLSGADQDLALERLVLDLDNYRAALEWSLDKHGNPEAGLRLATALQVVWETHGVLREGRRWTEHALAVAHDAPEHLRARALRTAGALARPTGDYEAALKHFENSLALLNHPSALADRADVLRSMGHTRHDQSAFDTARELYEQALSLSEQAHDAQGVAVALGNLGLIAETRGQLDLADSLYTRCLASLEQLGDQRNVASTQLNLSNIARERGDYKRAEALLDACALIYGRLNDSWSLAYVELNRGTLSETYGLGSLALEYYRNAWQTCAKLGDRWAEAHARTGMGRAALLIGDEPFAATCLRDALVLRTELADSEGTVRSLESVAELALHRSNLVEAVELWAAAEALGASIGTVTPALERQARAHGLAYAARTLSADRFEQAQARGAALSVEQAIAQALVALRPI